MISIDVLWNIVKKEKITVKYTDLQCHRNTLYGLYFLDEFGGPIIILETKLKHLHTLEKCTLAEEIGHFKTSPSTNFLKAYTSYNNQINMSKDERKALQWATDFLIPDRKLTVALKAGYRNCFDLAEYFEVTETFIHTKLNFLKTCFRRSGLKTKARDLFDLEM